MITIAVNLEVMEGMLYFWEATRSREKVNERFITEMASHPAMQSIYDGEFDSEVFRRVLSAVTNREPLAPVSRKEGRFFNNNLWMLEDLSLTREMMAQIKTLNLDAMAAELSREFEVDLHTTVYFLPLHLEPVYTPGKSLAVNFFRITPDFSGGASFEGQPLLDYLKDQLQSLCRSFVQ